MTTLQNRRAYFLLIALQVAGALLIVFNGIPEFRQLIANPGEQLAHMQYDDPVTIGTMIAMQVAYWYRLQRVSIPFLRSNILLNHIFLFVGRLIFIFGSSLFGVVFFRHLPEIINQAPDILLMTRRGVELVVSLFALFCVTLELERLGRALDNRRQN